MVQKKEAINIVSLLIGSGLTVFAVSTFYADFIKKPNIDVSLFGSESFSNSSGINILNRGMQTAHNATAHNATLYVLNRGMQTAHNVTLILTARNISYFPASLIYEQNRKDVNIIKDGSNKLLINIPTLVSHGEGASLKIVIPSLD